MSYKIVIDSCGELTPEMKSSGKFSNIPLTLQVDNLEIIDDETFHQKEFLEAVAKSPNCPKSACPSPEKYKEACEGAEEHVYIVTLSANLSGSYNSAVLGRELYLEEQSEKSKNIHVFNSRSASVGQSLIALKIQECEEKGMPFCQVVEETEKYIGGMRTYFVLENLETLRKNGRLGLVKALVASALKIKPVMGEDGEGNILQLDQARGINKALMKMIDHVEKNIENPQEKILGITNCNCPERAEMIREELERRLKVKDIIMVEAAGVSSMYANDGGIIIAV
ncbi:MAG: DegV family protein [Lachnospiraceae bacterium]|nr:DegV family protein [Lachnospiraceae bacterium]